MEPTNSSKYDVDTLRRAVQLIAIPAWERGDIVELRALGTKRAFARATSMVNTVKTWFLSPPILAALLLASILR